MTVSPDPQLPKILDRFGSGELHAETVWEDDSRSGVLVSETSTNAAPIFLRGAEFARLMEELRDADRPWIKTDAEPSGRMFRYFIMGGDMDSAQTGKPAYEVHYRQPHGGFDLTMAVYEYPGQEGEPAFSFDLYASSGAVMVESAPLETGFKLDEIAPIADVREAIHALRYQGKVVVAFHGTPAEIHELEVGLLAPSPEATPSPRLAC